MPDPVNETTASASPAPPHSPLRQLAIQGAAVILVLSLAWPFYGIQGEAMPWLPTALVIGAVAATLATLTRQAPWWRIMHAGFAPLAWLVTQWQVDPGWFLLAFMLLLLIYRGAISGQVPLYFSNRATVLALQDLLAAQNERRFIDLGAGVGSTLLPLAKALPHTRMTGVENAPLTWLTGWLRSRGKANLDWRWGNLWDTPLHEYDVAYAFLSPAPMTALWEKAKKEMRPGALLISNSFPIPDVEPEVMIEVACEPPRPLYWYRV